MRAAADCPFAGVPEPDRERTHYDPVVLKVKRCNLGGRANGRPVPRDWWSTCKTMG